MTVRRGVWPVLWLALAALLAGVLASLSAGQRAAQAQASPSRLGLAPAYVVQRVNSPTPARGGQLGWLGIANAGDLDRDGKDDLLVPQYNGPGSIHLISGRTGGLIRTLTLPDPASGGMSEGNFVYPAKLADLASCSGGQTSQTCPRNPMGPPDGVPEVLVGATGVDVGAAFDVGRAYVFDGATGALLKRAQMPPEDLASEAAQFPQGKGFAFGRAVVSPASAYPENAPRSVKIGDLDGGGTGDFAVSNPTFYERGPATNPSCTPGPCPGSGRVYFFRGEDVAGSDPSVVLDQPLKVVRNPMAQTGEPHDRFGHAILPVGDVGRCTLDPGPGAACPDNNRSAGLDGRPDVLVAEHQAEFPAGFPNAGVAWLLDGPTGATLRMYPHPEPQAGVLFGYTSGTMSTAIGDVGSTVAPDLLVPAVGQALRFTHQGRAYVLNGDFRTAFSGVTLGRLDDPTPHRGENFGAPFAGVGDVAGDPRNEVLVGNAGPWQTGDADNRFTGDIHVFSPQSEEVLLTLSDPDEQAGSGFGQGVAQLGDLDDDGFMDFAATAGFYTDSVLREGRLYIFRSAVRPIVPLGAGYRLAAADGGIFAFGDARFLGSMGGVRLNRPVVGTASTPSGNGYWLVASDGGIFAFGDARFFGSTGNIRLNQPVVGMASTPSGNGYWLVASDGGIFAFGDARFFGSTGNIRLNRPVVGMASTPSGNGYWLVASDGGIFAFGDARFLGSTGNIRLNRPVVGMASTPSGNGYWLVASDGGIFAFGDARFLGSTGNIRLNQPVVAMARS